MGCYSAGMMRRVLGFLVAISGALAAFGDEMPDFDWARGLNVQFGRVAFDRAGNGYVCATIPGRVTLPGIVTLGTNILNSTNGPVLLGKFDRRGNWLWVRQAGNTNAGPDTAYGTGVAVDSATNIVITGFGMTL